VRVTIGGWAQGASEATCAKKRTRSPSGRASILKKGLPSVGRFDRSINVNRI
jgi:hypothetical protein